MLIFIWSKVMLSRLPLEEDQLAYHMNVKTRDAPCLWEGESNDDRKRLFPSCR